MEIPADIQDLFDRMRKDPELERMARSMFLGQGRLTEVDATDTQAILTPEDPQRIDEQFAEAEEFAPEQRRLLEQLKSFNHKIGTFKNNVTQGVALSADESVEMVMVLADTLATWSNACWDNEPLGYLIAENYEDGFKTWLETIADAKHSVVEALSKWPEPISSESE